MQSAPPPQGSLPSFAGFYLVSPLYTSTAGSRYFFSLKGNGIPPIGSNRLNMVSNVSHLIYSILLYCSAVRFIPLLLFLRISGKPSEQAINANSLSVNDHLRRFSAITTWLPLIHAAPSK
jgi:hypothetical protein